MKRTCGLLLSFVLIVGTANAAADTRIIVRNTLGSFAMNTTCLLLGCKVQERKKLTIDTAGFGYTVPRRICSG